MKRTRKELSEIGAGLGMEEVRILVSSYYRRQTDRKRTKSQVDSITESEAKTEGLRLLCDRAEEDEKVIKTLMDVWTDNDRLSVWAKSNYGIGPVLAAGLRAFINLERAPTVGHIWAYAGLDPSKKWHSKKESTDWLKMELAGRDRYDRGMVLEALLKFGFKLARAESLLEEFWPEGAEICGRDTVASMMCVRPWNAKLKTICWNMGECFKKFSGREECVYGRIYLARKVYEMEKNEKGEYAEQAQRQLERFSFGKSTTAYKEYSEGRLPMAHIGERAKRYAVKMFLSHWHNMGYRIVLGKEPPMPYPIVHMGHCHYIEPPNGEEFLAKLIETP